MPKRDLYDPAFGAEAESPGKWFLVSAGVAVALAFGIVGTWDYETAKVEECASKPRQYYSAKEDRCLPVPATRKADHEANRWLCKELGGGEECGK